MYGSEVSRWPARALNFYFAFSASLSTVDLIGPLPLPSVLSPPPDAFMPSSASPFSGSGGGTAFPERSIPDAAAAFDACQHRSVRES